MVEGVSKEWTPPLSIHNHPTTTQTSIYRLQFPGDDTRLRLSLDSLFHHMNWPRHCFSLEKIPSIHPSRHFLGASTMLKILEIETFTTWWELFGNFNAISIFTDKHATSNLQHPTMSQLSPTFHSHVLFIFWKITFAILYCTNACKSLDFNTLARSHEQWITTHYLIIHLALL